MPPYSTFWVSLTIIVIVYWNLPRLLRLPLLSIASCVWLYYLDASAAAGLAVASVIFYGFAPRPKTPPVRARLTLWILILGLLGYLAYYKYLPPLAGALRVDSPLASLALPLGISYFTFKLIHYAVERRRGTLEPHNFIDFTCYITLFTTFSAGPIERFDHFLSNRSTQWQASNVVEGLTRIAHGLVKRFAVAEFVLPGMFGRLPPVEDLVTGLPDTAAWQVWRFVILTYLYAYLDFSAYADIAIGSSRLFGIRIMENFNIPLAAQNISDFWARWHMTLAGWCQAYVYMPLLGLTRNPYVAVYASFITIGLWHAGDAQWLAWGAYHATGVATFTAWRRFMARRRPPTQQPTWQRWLGYPLTFLFVAAGYSLTSTYGHGTIYDSLRILAKLFAIDLS